MLGLEADVSKSSTQLSWLRTYLGVAAPALSLFFATEGGGQEQKCDLAAVTSSLLLCVHSL